VTVRYEVDLGELQRVVDGLDAFAERFDAQLRALDRANGELHLSWEGEAATAQTTAHATLTRGAREVHRALIELRDAAADAHGQYRAAARANLQTWQQLG
jgi:WXG100 family type VII secretion target